MTDFELRLGEKKDDGPALPPGDAPSDSDPGPAGGPSTGPANVGGHPVAGYMAVATALMGIFFNGLLFVPLSLIFSIVSIARSQGIWGWAGLLLALLAFVTSPTLMGLLGLGTLIAILH